MNPLLLVDSYKIHHKPMYSPGMTKLYSNGTCRKSRLEGVNEVVVFEIQHFVKKYLIEQFNNEFFNKLLKELIIEYKRQGLLKVTYDDNMNIVCADQQSWEQEKQGLLTTVFKDGKLIRETTLEEIRNKLNTII